jgi:hypothetical protein
MASVADASLTHVQPNASYPSTGFATTAALLEKSSDQDFLHIIRVSPKLLVPSSEQKTTWLEHMPYKRIAQIGDADSISKLLCWMIEDNRPVGDALGEVLGILNQPDRLLVTAKVIAFSRTLSSLGNKNPLDFGVGPYIENRFNSFPNIGQIVELRRDCSNQIDDIQKKLAQAWKIDPSQCTLGELPNNIDQETSKLIHQRDKKIAVFIQYGRRPSVKANPNSIKV